MRSSSWRWLMMMDESSPLLSSPLPGRRGVEQSRRRRRGEEGRSGSVGYSPSLLRRVGYLFFLFFFLLHYYYYSLHHFLVSLLQRIQFALASDVSSISHETTSKILLVMGLFGRCAAATTNTKQCFCWPQYSKKNLLLNGANMILFSKDYCISLYYCY